MDCPKSSTSLLVVVYAKSSTLAAKLICSKEMIVLNSDRCVHISILLDHQILQEDLDKYFPSEFFFSVRTVYLRVLPSGQVWPTR